MKTKFLKFIYNEHTVDFSNGENLMVNATQMAEIFDKQVNEFLSNKTTLNFISTCLKNGNSRFLNIKKEEDLFISKQKTGTWMHRILALKFAAWLHPEFELWVYTTIDGILMGHYNEHKQATIEKIKAEQEYEELQKELKNHPRFIKLNELKNTISSFTKAQRKVITNAVKQLEFDFGKN